MFFTIVGLLALAAAQVQASPHAQSNSTSCRAVPGSPDWPSTDAWAKLNETTQGRLIKAVPPGAVCHPSQPTFSAAKCAEVQYRWFDEFFHSDDPVSVEWNNWANDTCLPFENFTCSGLGYPLYVINATEPAHIKAGIAYANKHNIRLVVKNSGHDFMGRSTAPNALSIWVHHLRGVTLHEKSFSPKSCNVTIDGAAMTALAGTQMIEAYEGAARIKHTIVGGNGRTVALGGFITGAGHSILAPHYGLATDQVLEMEMVTPSGELLTLNECQNTDLFWAMRGGGGGTFGVLTSVTMKIFPSPAVMEMNFHIATGAENLRAFDMIAYVVSQFPDLADKGVSGYPLIFNAAPNFLGNESWLIKGIMGKVIMLNTRDPSDMLSLWQPILNHVNATWEHMSAAVNTTYYRDFNEWFGANYDPSPTGREAVMSSRLLDRDALTKDPAALKLALAKFSALSSQATVYIVSGKGVREAKPRGGSNAVLPAWRRTYVHATSSIFFFSESPEAKDYALRGTAFFGDSLRELAPYTGAYMNEASRYEPNFQQAFWGENYDRLLKIKRAVDPDDVFWCMPCVGNERWQEVDDRLCRV